MFETAVCLLLVCTGVVVYLAIDAVRWRLPRRMLLVGLSIPLGALSGLALWTVVANPNWPANPAWHRGMATGFGPDWVCSGRTHDTRSASASSP
jgi:hypothetical protein